MLKTGISSRSRRRALCLCLILSLLACLAGAAGPTVSLADTPAAANTAPVLTALNLIAHGRIDVAYSGAPFTYNLANLVLSGADQNGSFFDLSGQTVTWAVDSQAASLNSDGHTITITDSGPVSVTATVAGITSNTYVINVTNAISTASLLIKVLSKGAVAQSVTVTADMINALNPGGTIFQYSYVDAANRHKYYSALGASLTGILTRYASVTDLSAVQNVVVTGTDNYQAWWPCYQMDVQHLLFGPLYYYPDGSGTNPMNQGYTAYDDTDKQVTPTIIATLENGDPLRHFTSAGQLDGTKCLRIFTGMQNISDQENNNSVKWIKEIDVTVSAALAGGAGAKPAAGAAVAPTSTAVSAQVFADVPASYWAFGKINRLSGLGDLTGYPDGAFRPDGAITRAEFVSILAKVMKLPASDNTALGFVDVSPGDWYGGSVNCAVYAGIIKGYGSNFNPDQPITREQVATILVSALGKQDEARANMNARPGFADDTAISPWARGFVAVAMQDGLIKGYPDDNSFRPQSSATRAEACAMIDSFMKAYQ